MCRHAPSTRASSPRRAPSPNLSRTPNPNRTPNLSRTPHPSPRPSLAPNLSTHPPLTQALTPDQVRALTARLSQLDESQGRQQEPQDYVAPCGSSTTPVRMGTAGALSSKPSAHALAAIKARSPAARGQP